MYFVGCGISGGEEGALHGASIMPGGAQEAWPVIQPMLKSIAAKAEDGTPCCEWVGPGGAGHYVKMVHNGIEYGDMQLIAETYFAMKHLLALKNEQMADIFEQWNKGHLHSYLIEITSAILRHKEEGGDYLLDNILDAAGQKGTGRWSVINSLQLNTPLGVIAEAVFARNLSAEKNLRVLMSKHYMHVENHPVYNYQDTVAGLESTLYAARLIGYAQGFALMRTASEQYGWKLNLSTIALLWRAGCIIRSAFSERHCRGLSPCAGIVASVAGRAFRTGSNGSPARVEEIHRCHVERRIARTCTFRSVELFSGSDHQPFPSQYDPGDA